MIEPTVSIKYVHERLYDLLSHKYSVGGHYEVNEELCYFLDELAENYKKEAGESIYEDENEDL